MGPMDTKQAKAPLADIDNNLLECQQAQALLQRQQELNDRIIRTANALLITLDAQANILVFNDFAEQVTGYCSTEVRGRNWFDLFIPADNREHLRSIFQDSLNSPKPHWEHENHIACKDGSKRLISWKNSTIRDEQGQVVTILAIGLDNTELRLFEKRLFQNERLATLALLVPGITHEINNPNNFITFNLPILRDYLAKILPIMDEYARQHPDQDFFSMSYHEFRQDIYKLLDNMEHGTERITRAVSRLREFVRPNTGEKMHQVAIRETIEQGLAICRPQISKLVKTLAVDFSEDLPATVFTDPLAIEQALLNLLINAAEAAADPQNSRITVQVKPGDDPPDEYLVIEIRDNGGGIDQEIAPRIFDPFFTTKKTGTAAGLGLFVSRGLIEGLGGRLTLAGSPGSETTFRIILPEIRQGSAIPTD